MRTAMTIVGIMMFSTFIGSYAYLYKRSKQLEVVETQSEQVEKKSQEVQEKIILKYSDLIEARENADAN